MPRRKTLSDYLGGGMGTARDTLAVRARAKRQDNARGMGLARDVKAGSASPVDNRWRARKRR